MKLLRIRIVALFLLFFQLGELSAQAYLVAQRPAPQWAAKSSPRRRQAKRAPVKQLKRRSGPRRLRARQQKPRRVTRMRQRRQVVSKKEIHYSPSEPFSRLYPKFFPEDEAIIEEGNKEIYLWQENQTVPFNELILSWNAERPDAGLFSFYVSAKESGIWSPWQKLAEWAPCTQQTFCNSRHGNVHTKHVRIEIVRRRMATGFRVKAVAQDGASIRNVHALFANVSNLNKFKINGGIFSQPSVLIKDIMPQSQMTLNHHRRHDLCAPTSTSMLVRYFADKYGGKQKTPLHDDVIEFAELAHDDSYLNIYGCWPLVVAQAYQATGGQVFFRAERLNGFAHLYKYIQNKIPVAVSVRRLRGGALPYENGHYIVVIGWNKDTQKVRCIDPAFKGRRRTIRDYNLRDFLVAWSRSRNLGYVPMPRDGMFALKDLWALSMW